MGRNVNRRTYLTRTGLVLVAALAGCAGGDGGVGTPTPTSAVSDVVTITDEDWDIQRSTPAVTGTVENTGDRPVALVSLDVTFYDKNGTRIHESDTSIEDLAPNERTAFEVRYTGTDWPRMADYDLGVDDSESRL